MHRSITREREISSVMIRVRRMVLKLSEGAGDVEDVAQDVMVKLLKVRAFEKEIGSGWLYEVAKNCLLDRRRKTAMERQFLDRGLYLDTAGAVRDCYGDEKVCVPAVCESGSQWEPEQAALVEKIVSELPERLRKTLVLAAEGMTYEAIATQTGANLGTVRSRLYYARKYVRKRTRSQIA